MEQKAILQQIGLTDGESRVYLALLDAGRASTNTVHEKTGIERRNIYDILNKLIERGIVTYNDENKRRTFFPVHPRSLLHYLDEKKKKIDSMSADLSKELPSLVAKFEEKKKQSIRSQTFRGGEALKSVWNDMLNYDAIYWIGSGNYVPSKFPAFYADWTVRRIGAGVKAYHLSRKDATIEPKPLMQIRKLPAEFNGQPAVQCVFGNKVNMLLFGEEIFVFQIESKDLATNMKAYHQYLWNNVASK